VSLSIAEPSFGDGSEKLVFTLKVKDGDPLHVTALSAPAHGAAVSTPDGRLTVGRVTVTVL
jgi:hypothetical protein